MLLREAGAKANRKRTLLASRQVLTHRCLELIQASDELRSLQLTDGNQLIVPLGVVLCKVVSVAITYLFCLVGGCSRVLIRILLLKRVHRHYMVLASGNLVHHLRLGLVDGARVISLGFLPHVAEAH